MCVTIVHVIGGKNHRCGKCPVLNNTYWRTKGSIDRLFSRNRPNGDGRCDKSRSKWRYR
jgi:hypothetical protein